MSARPRIVIVNDDPTQLRGLQGVLEAEYTTIPFSDPTAALYAMSGDVHVDLVIVDLHMPEIDGWRICHLLRSPQYEAFNETPILVVSATFTGTDVEAITRDLTANAFLTMPVSSDRLRSCVGDLLAGRHQRSTETVLIIDGDRDDALSLADTFSRHGYEVHRTDSYLKAPDLVGKFDPGVIVVDYGLRGMGGSELVSLLRRPADPRVILVTSDDASPTAPIASLRAGAAGFIRKPFDPEYVVDLAGKAKRERALLRVEEFLEGRTRELQASEARYRSLFETIPDAILCVDRSGLIVQSNPSATELFGRHSSDGKGRSFGHLALDDDRASAEAHMERVWRNRGGVFGAILVGREGSVIETDVSAQPTSFEGEEVMLLVLRDMTEARALERERQLAQAKNHHAQKLESLGVLAGGIAHDFNNMLMSVIGNAGLALGVLPEDHEAVEFVRQIEVAGARAAEFTSQILTYSGKGPSSLEPLHLNDIVEEIGSLLDSAISKKATLECRLAPDLPHVEADGSQLRQVVINLIMNASDALEKRPGAITVRTGCDQSWESLDHGKTISTSDSGTCVWIEVSDTGSGMSESTQARMFDPFFTTKVTGRGVGLASVMGIIKNHGGTVSVESELGVGTRVRASFPAGPTDVDAAVELLEEPVLEHGCGTLLVVDDDAAIRRVLSSGLKRRGFRVLAAEDGHRGVELFHEHRAEIRATVLDLTMPGLDGSEVLAQIRQADPNAAVVLSSGFMENAIHAGLDQDDITVFLHKPYGMDHLLGALTRLSSPTLVPPRGTPREPVARSGLELV